MMRSDEPAGAKFKHVRADFPNIALLNKSATLGNIQLTSCHASVGNNSLGETATALSLEISL